MLGRGERDSSSDDTPRGQVPPGAPVRQERRVRAWIGASVVVRGDLTSSEDMTIAGRVEGDVSVRENQLTLAPGARIAGDVVARGVAIHGHIEGDVTAEDTIEIGETGSVLGNVTAPRMIVAEGAVLHGRAEIREARPVPAE